MNQIPRQLTTAPNLGAIGLQPYESRNIRLSSALCAFGFALRINSEPATVIIDSETQRSIVAFWHDMILPNESAIHQQLPSLTANHLGLWWTDPKQFSVEGYDDALHAMRRVFEAREWLIKVVKGAIPVPKDGRLQRATITESLHIASVIRACNQPLVAFDRGTFVFASKAAPIAALISSAENSKSSTRLENQKVAMNQDLAAKAAIPAGVPDACVDWMLVALKYRDWLHRIVRSKGCVPLIEKRDGERCLRISSQMPKTLRKEFLRRF
jgi:hypothetical protein